MPCAVVNLGHGDSGIVCFQHRHRLKLSTGKYIYMEFHRWCGPSFWFDRNQTKPIDDWFDRPEIVAAFDTWMAANQVKDSTPVKEVVLNIE